MPSLLQSFHNRVPDARRALYLSPSGFVGPELRLVATDLGEVDSAVLRTVLLQLVQGRDAVPHGGIS